MGSVLTSAMACLLDTSEYPRARTEHFALDVVTGTEVTVGVVTVGVVTVGVVTVGVVTVGMVTVGVVTVGVVTVGVVTVGVVTVGMVTVGVVTVPKALGVGTLRGVQPVCKRSGSAATRTTRYSCEAS
jgi:hypothetical protein